MLNDGTTKNGDGRWLPIPKECEVYFDSIPNECEYLFAKFENGEYLPLGYPCKRTKQIIPSFRKAWDSACSRSEIEGYNFHKTRQQAAMQLLYEGWTELEVMMVGGWRSIAAFRRYVHADEILLQKRLGKWEIDTRWYTELAPVPWAPCTH